jgi:hypothetical protein
MPEVEQGFQVRTYLRGILMFRFHGEGTGNQMHVKGGNAQGAFQRTCLRTDGLQTRDRCPEALARKPPVSDNESRPSNCAGTTFEEEWIQNEGAS